MSVTEQLATLTHCLEEMGSDLLYCNLTTPDCEAFGVHTVRAIIPEFQPIHFGRKERRLGGERLFELPRRLGLRRDRVRLDELNDDPHPLA